MGLKLCGRHRLDGVMGGQWLGLVVILLVFAFAGCGTKQSVERGSDGTTINLDRLSEDAREQARRNLARKLNQDVAVFHVNIGEEYSVYFDINTAPSSEEYRIQATDKLYVAFLNDTENSREVIVRPDGNISLPLIGSIKAAGYSSDALAHEIQHRYSLVGGQNGMTRPPQTTVEVTRSHSATERFIAMIGTANKGDSMVTTVLPDGTISLPGLKPVAARGQTLQQLEKVIDTAYLTSGLNVTVTLVPKVLRPGSTMVFGEVGKPGRVELDRPHTVLMTVAQAGGVLPTGSMDAVRVLYMTNDGRAMMRRVNLKEEIDDLRVEDDMIVPDNSVIYVPPTDLTKAGRFTKALAEVLQYTGFNLNLSYIFNQPSSGTTSTIGGGGP